MKTNMQKKRPLDAWPGRSMLAKSDTCLAVTKTENGPVPKNPPSLTSTAGCQVNEVGPAAPDVSEDQRGREKMGQMTEMGKQKREPLFGYAIFGYAWLWPENAKRCPKVWGKACPANQRFWQTLLKCRTSLLSGHVH